MGQTCCTTGVGVSGEVPEPLKDLGCHICQQEMNAYILKMEPNTANQPAQVTFPFYLKTTDCDIFIPLADILFL